MKVAIVYHIIPHYRAAIMRALDQSERHEYSFFGDTAVYDGIKPIAPDALTRYVAAPFREFRGLLWQQASVLVALSPKFDAIIYLGNPNFVSTWVGALLGRMTGKRVIFWAHGWLKPESALKSLLRRTFYRLAHRVMVYGERAKTLGVADGFPESRISVIYNSLDYNAATQVLKALESGGGGSVNPREFFSDPARPLIVCTARLTQQCRFDLLLNAARQLRDRDRPINILLVGDGPERPAIERLAQAQQVDVHLFGACYDESLIGAVFYSADITISPGKVGLTALHSLMYGTPVITHSCLDAQMPEVEAITDGETGAFFVQNSVEDLTRTIERWLIHDIDRMKVRKACRAIISKKWNPTTQARLIEAALIGGRPCAN